MLELSLADLLLVKYALQDRLNRLYDLQGMSTVDGQPHTNTQNRVRKLKDRVQREYDKRLRGDA